jgi:phospholipase C
VDVLKRFGTLGVAGAALSLAAGCSPPASVGPAAFYASAPRVDPMTQVSRRISHVVIIVQENRSFDNFFAGYPGANAPTYGCGKLRGSAASSSGCPPGDERINLTQFTFQRDHDLPHAFESGITDWDNGEMDGFNQEGQSNDTESYSYIERSQVATYWSIANQYVLADAMFPTEFGPSWTAHLTLVAGTDDVTSSTALADFADGHSDCSASPGTKTTIVNTERVVEHGAGPFPCLGQFNTMAEALDNAGISWKYYVAKRLKSFIWSPFAAIKYVYEGSDWDKNIVAPNTQILNDIKDNQLASVSWVTPSERDSDAPAAHSDTGPSWVASVINAIGESSYWDSTAIVVIWDDWGGFYDNVPPPQLDFRGLGIRVSCLILSPYARKAYVSHTQYEFGSILKFIEEAFPNVGVLGNPSRGYTDSRAHSIRDAFDFSKPPRAFVPIKAKYPASYFLHEPPSDQPPDNE